MLQTKQKGACTGRRAQTVVRRADPHTALAGARCDTHVHLLKRTTYLRHCTSRAYVNDRHVWGWNHGTCTEDFLDTVWDGSHRGLSASQQSALAHGQKLSCVLACHHGAWSTPTVWLRNPRLDNLFHPPVNFCCLLRCHVHVGRVLRVPLGQVEPLVLRAHMAATGCDVQKPCQLCWWYRRCCGRCWGQAQTPGCCPGEYQKPYGGA